MRRLCPRHQLSYRRRPGALSLCRHGRRRRRRGDRQRARRRDLRRGRAAQAAAAQHADLHGLQGIYAVRSERGGVEVLRLHRRRRRGGGKARAGAAHARQDRLGPDRAPGGDSRMIRASLLAAALAAALLPASASAAAKDQIDQKTPVVVDPARSYIFFRARKAPVRFLREVDAEERAVYDSERAAAYEKAYAKYTKKLAQWRKAEAEWQKADSSGRQRMERPEKPVR